jgi:hypothetical protein
VVNLKLICLVSTRESGHTLRFEGDIIKLDNAMFGYFFIYPDKIVYERSEKCKDEKYRLGPTPKIGRESRKGFRVWNFNDIDRIVTTKYNHIKQAIEIFLNNHKSVFIVLYSERCLNDLWKELKIRVQKSNVKLIDDSKKREEIAAARDDWLKLRISTFDYLLKLNHGAGRTFSVLSEYPVFPWIIKDYTSNQLNLNNDIYRELKYPVAGITEDKREKAMVKYEATKSIPEMCFQYGTHYIQVRGVLEYLMRLQPFTQFKNTFDEGNNSPERHFHSIEHMWNIIVTDTSMTLELVPEFFYLPEFLANL